MIQFCKGFYDIFYYFLEMCIVICVYVGLFRCYVCYLVFRDFMYGFEIFCIRVIWVLEIKWSVFFVLFFKVGVLEVRGIMLSFWVL